MSRQEARQAERLVRGLAERFEICRQENGGWCATVHWFGEGQSLYFNLDDVKAAVASRRQK